MRLHSLVLSALLAIGVAGSAEAYSARNGFNVQSMSNGNFQVMNKGGLSDQNAWCAAGDFAMSVMGVPPGALIYRVSPPPRPRGANIEFSMSAAGAASSTGLATLGGNGTGSMSAVAARNMCNVVMSPNRR
jgi:hypothetical protein